MQQNFVSPQNNKNWNIGSVLIKSVVGILTKKNFTRYTEKNKFSKKKIISCKV